MATTWALCVSSSSAAESLEAQVREVLEQNRKLQEQVSEQQRLIERLSTEMKELREASEERAREMDELQAGGGRRGRGDSTVRVSGELGIGWFDTSAAGQFPNSEFRVDDAKIAVEAKVWRNAFAFAQLDIFARETNDESVGVSELYLDVEDVFGNGLASVRVGRMNIPFGEEYQFRGVIANPLISHSLSDIWGFDEGIEVYGSASGVSYVVAVQNGGHSALKDFDADKSVVARVSYDPAPWLHMSGSAMRTGRLNVAEDSVSELWFANRFFRSIGGAGSTETFSVRLYEIDVTGRWSSGRISAAAGWVNYDDADQFSDNSRSMNYHFIEAVQELGERLYGAARYSAIHVGGGYPMAGFGDAGTFFYRPTAPLMESLRRMSLGFGYRFGPPLVLKLEYAIEHGRVANGTRRADEHFLATEIGLKF